MISKSRLLVDVILSLAFVITTNALAPYSKLSFLRESYVLSSSSSSLSSHVATPAPSGAFTATNIVTSTNKSKMNKITMNKFPSSRIKLNGVDHYIRDTGDPSSDAPVAILLHGLAGSTDSWEDVAPLLFEGGVRAIAIDRVGFGRTERPTAPSLMKPPMLLPSFVRESVASTVESSIPEVSFLIPDVIKDLLPPPNKALATAIRRPTLLAPKLPWSMSKYKTNPYSSEFAVSTLWPLLEKTLSKKMKKRRIYFVGHSAGGPIALQAFLKNINNNAMVDVAGVALVAPAVLDPEEDPGIYDYDDEEENMTDEKISTSQNNNNNKDNNNNNIRLTVFKSLLSLPDAFVVPMVRRIYDGRNMTEAVLNQTSSTETTLSFERTKYLAQKYTRPVDEFPNDWDVGLLNVYRADLLLDENEGRLRGRKLLSKVREEATKKMLIKNNSKKRPIFCVISGRDDPVVPAKASKRIADILSQQQKNDSSCYYVEIPNAGHLPMDEKPKDMANALLDFMK